ncbi:50S ribosomal protein L6 [Candidatus Uhrbacteria bacterium]|nr:50S ribosomal protein L6 [Candidatus Uhrbacteria bacterium]
MSRVGKVPITIPSGVTIAAAAGRVDVRGPKGVVTVPVHPHVTVTDDAGVLRVTVAHPTQKHDRALWGLTARLLQNACTGVTKGFERQLEIHGVGFRAEVRGSALELALGFSHPVHFPLPDGITASVEKNVITLRGFDRQVVGETAARLHRLRKPDAYHGKGVRFAGVPLKLKPGKAAKTGTAAK